MRSLWFEGVVMLCAEKNTDKNNNGEKTQTNFISKDQCHPSNADIYHLVFHWRILDR